VPSLKTPPNTPRAAELRQAHEFAFDECVWHLHLKMVEPCSVTISNDLPFQQYLGRARFCSGEDLARQAVIRAIVAMVSRVGTGFFVVGFQGRKNIAAATDKKKQLFRTKLRTRIRGKIWEAIDQGGYAGLLELEHAARPLPVPEDDDPEDMALQTDPGPEDHADAVSTPDCQNLSGIAAASSTVAEPPPEPPTFPWAPKAELEKALKYVLVAPLQISIVAVGSAREKLKAVSANDRGKPYLSGTKGGMPSEAARSAVAVTFRHLVRMTSPQMFNEIAPPVGTMVERLAIYRGYLKQGLAAAITKDGHAGLVRLCKIA
jgi:hypothetical protein